MKRITAVTAFVFIITSLLVAPAVADTTSIAIAPSNIDITINDSSTISRDFTILYYTGDLQVESVGIPVTVSPSVYPVTNTHRVITMNIQPQQAYPGDYEGYIRFTTIPKPGTPPLSVSISVQVNVTNTVTPTPEPTPSPTPASTTTTPAPGGWSSGVSSGGLSEVSPSVAPTANPPTTSKEPVKTTSTPATPSPGETVTHTPPTPPTTKTVKPTQTITRPTETQISQPTATISSLPGDGFPAKGGSFNYLWLLLFLIPVAGAVLYLIWLFTKSAKEMNDDEDRF